VKELLDKAGTKGHVVMHYNNQDFDVDVTLEIKSIEGDAWTNIRKGKKLTCFNYELKIDFSGFIAGGSNKWDLGGKVEYEIAVDDDAPETRFAFKQRYPFQPQLQKAILGFITAKFQIFVKELSEKGETKKKEGFAANTQARIQVGQYQRYDEGPDGVAALQQTAEKYSEERRRKEDDNPGKHLHCDVKTH